MKNLISASTGCFYDIYRSDINVAIENIIKSRIDVDGIELMFPSREDLLNFQVRFDIKKFLNSLQYNSIHMPWNNIFYSEKEVEFIKKVDDISDKINAKTLVFHTDVVSDYSLIISDKTKTSVENPGSKEKYGSKISEIKEILSNHPKVFFTVDLAHLLVNKWDIKEIKQLKNRIVEMHISIHRNSYHAPLNPDKGSILEEIKFLDCPLVVECKIKNISELETELDFIRSKTR